MFYKNGKRACIFWGRLCFYCGVVFYISGAFLIKLLFNSLLSDI